MDLKHPTSPSPTPPRHWAGCSRGTVLLTIALVGISLAIAAWQGLLWYVDYTVKKQMPPAEYAEYQAWLQTPIPPPTTADLDYEPMPPDLMAERDRLLQDLDHTLDNDTKTVFRDTRSSLSASLIAGAPLSAEQQEFLTTATLAYQPFADRAKALAQTPGYLYNRQSISDEFDYRVLFTPIFTPGIFHHIYREEFDEAIDLIDSALAFSHIDEIAPNVDQLIVRAQALRTAQAARVLATRTSNTQSLTRLLTILSRHHQPIFHHGSEKQLLGLTYMRWRNMIKEGYIDLPTGDTPIEDIVATTGNIWSYLLWLDKTQRTHPTTSTVASLFRAELRSAASYVTLKSDPVGYISTRITQTPSLSFLHPMAGSVTARQVQNHLHENYVGNQKFRSQLVTDYDLTRLWLARRIAELRGDPLPLTQSDFVPRYLPDWPADPFSPTGAGFSFDAARGEFYSVGEDGAPGTADDVYLEIPTGAATDDTTTTTTDARHAE